MCSVCVARVSLQALNLIPLDACGHLSVEKQRAREREKGKEEKKKNAMYHSLELSCVGSAAQWASPQPRSCSFAPFFWLAWKILETSGFLDPVYFKGQDFVSRKFRSSLDVYRWLDLMTLKKNFFGTGHGIVHEGRQSKFFVPVTSWH